MTPSAEDPPEAPARPAPPGRTGPWRSPETWRSALREFAIIVAGVLAALGAQAWWESRQEREREEAYLVQLLAEARQNQERVAEAIAEDSVSEIAMGRALAALDRPGPAPDPDSLMSWLLRSGIAADFQPLTGTYRALLGTGDLRLVRDDSLRARVVNYAAVLDNESMRQQQLRGEILNTIPSYARALPFLRRVFDGGLAGADLDVPRLRADPEVAVSLFVLRATTINRLSGLRGVREASEEMVRTLEAAPGREERAGEAEPSADRD